MPPASSRDRPDPARAGRGKVNPWLKKLALAVFVPVVLLGTAELGLRLGHVGHDPSFFIPDPEPGMFRSNPRFTELFFPASFGLAPYNFRLAKKKPSGTVRIFVLGESAAMGVPEPGFALTPQLQAQLAQANPDRKIEVFNLGLTAINSHAVRLIAQEALTFEPDLLVVYMGNNEVVGPYGPSSTLGDQMTPLPVIRLSLWVKRTRLGQAMQNVIGRFGPKRTGANEWRGMEMFAGKTTRADDPRLTRVYANFRENLDDLLDRASRAGVKVLLSTVAVNLRDCAPFVSLHTSGLSAPALTEWQKNFDPGIRALELGQWDEAARALGRALELDPHFAEASFDLARVKEKQGDRAAARSLYLSAVNDDALRFRADGPINHLIRLSAAAHPDATLVDAASALGADGAAPEAPLSDHRLFFEHVHLTWEGNHALGQLMAAAAEKVLFNREHAWLGSAETAAVLGFTDFGRAGLWLQMETLTGRPPFTGQSTYAADRMALLTSIERIKTSLANPAALAACAAAIETSLKANPLNAFLTFHAASLNLQLGDARRALELNDRLQQLQPPSPERAAQRAVILESLQRPADAEQALLQSARDYPYYYQTYGLLAQLWSNTGQVARAIPWFQALVERMPESRGAREMYAQLLAASGDGKDAEVQWRQLLARTPDDEAALDPLVQRLLTLERTDEAIRLMLAAHDYNPRSFANAARLEQIFEQKGDVPHTVEFLQALAASGPVRSELHLDLAAALTKLGRNEEAQLELHRAQRAAHADGNSAVEQQAALLLQNAVGGR